MLTRTAEIVIPTVVASCLIRGYVLWKWRRARSNLPPVNTSIKSAETSEFGQGTLFISRCWVALLIGILGLSVWNDQGFVSGPRTAEAAWVSLLAVLSLIGLSWYVLGLLMRSSTRSLSFDNDGIWRTQVGKEQGLLRWGEICAVKELSSALSLFDRDGRLVLKVEYERDDYFRVRTQIMERMAFSPPALPLVVSASKLPNWTRFGFGCATLLFLGISVLFSTAARAHVLVPWFLFLSVLSGLLAIPGRNITIEADGIRIGRRLFAYSTIRSIEASFLYVRTRYIRRLQIDVGASRPVSLLTNGLSIDSLTLQRVILWACGHRYSRGAKSEPVLAY
jgi:hypothetical protein